MNDDVPITMCPDYGHPGQTYHPQQHRTWCRCGDVIYDGDTTRCPVCEDMMQARNWLRHEWCRQQSEDKRTLF